jgi:hypothetical protein
VADARRSVQNILNPNRVQEYLKCLRDMAIMKGLKRGGNSCKYSEKPARQSWFFHIWSKRLRLNAKDLNDTFLLR